MSLRAILVWLTGGALATLVAVWISAAVSEAPTPHEPAPTEPRVVSLSPPLTETLFALGAGPRVVARSPWCEVPDEVSALPTAGTALEPDLEALARQRPTLIVTEAVADDHTASLSRIAPTHALPWLTLEDAVASTRRLGELTGLSLAAKPIARRLETVLGVAPPADAPTALLAMGADGLAKGEVWFLQRQSLHGRALHAAGLRNVADEDWSGPPVMPVEELVRRDPQHVFVLVDSRTVPDTDHDAIRAAWARLPTTASRAGRIHVLSMPHPFTTGPSVLRVVDALREVLEGTEARR